MKTIKKLSSIALAASLLALPLAALTAAPEKPGDQKAHLKPYKLDVCLVSDEKLGEMGEPVVYEYKGQEIKFCCPSCQKKFDKEPEKYLQKMADLEKKAEADKKPKTGQ